MPHLARVGHGVDLASDGVELQLQLKKVNGDSVAGMSFDEAVRLPCGVRSMGSLTGCGSAHKSSRPSRVL